jgi:TPR repeat protein
MYMKGDGVSVDQSEAARWTQRSAEQGFAKAQFHLGLMYSQGLGVKRDDFLAEKWTELAAKQGHREAKEYLAILRFL